MVRCGGMDRREEWDEVRVHKKSTNAEGEKEQEEADRGQREVR